MSTAFLYAGQGSQHAGMGSDLYCAFPEFRKAFDSANLDFDLKKICFTDPDNVLIQTQYTQPALVAFACGMTAVLKHMGLQPDYVAGLSLGEYSALEAAGVFDSKTAIETAAFRGKAMAEASKGINCAMTAIIGLDEKALLPCCLEASAETKEIVSICNYNCPGQLVIGGTSSAVEVAARKALLAGAKKCVPLAVSGPFHTSYMKPAGDSLRKYFSSIIFKTADVPVLFNYTGDENPDNIAIPDLLVKQVQNSVKMENIIRRLFELGTDTFIEIGPGKTLSGFVRKTAREVSASNYRCFPVETAADLEGLKELLQ